MEVDEDKYYIFYDGDCGFCNFWVQWILKKDTKDIFLFAPLQGRFGQRFLTERNLERKQFNTLYLWKPSSYYLVKSDAIFKIPKILGGKYILLSSLNIFPRFLSNYVYDIISKNRLKMLPENCHIPNEIERKKFIE